MTTAETMEQLLNKNTAREVRRIINNEGKDSSKIIVLLLATFIAEYGNKNINMELNKKVSNEEWRKMLNDLDRMVEKMNEDEADYLRQQISNSADRKRIQVLKLLILAEVLSFSSTFGDKVDVSILSDLTTLKDHYKEKYNWKDIDEESCYENNLLWNGTSFKDRLRTNATAITSSLISSLIIGLNRKEKNLKATMKNKTDRWISRKVAEIMGTEKTAAAAGMTLEMAVANGIEKVQFKTMGDGDTCKLCQMYEDEIFNVDEAPILPLHPNERCYYIPYGE